MSVNKVIIVGNLGRDPEIRYMPSGDAIASIAADYKVCRGHGWDVQKKPAYAGPVAKKKATTVETTGVSDSTIAPEGGDGDGSGDGEDGDGDGDGDGPRRPPKSSTLKCSATKASSSPRAARPKSKPKLDPIVTMHARGLLTLILIFVLTLAAAFGFVLLEHEGLSYASLGLGASGGWALARCLVKPK